MNVFVFHAQDSQGCALAALLRHCDTDLRFQYLPVESPESVKHMQSFLLKHCLSPDTVGLPFVVSIQPLSNGDYHRNVLYGTPLVEWLGELIDAVIAAPTPPRGLCESVLANFLPQTLYLIAHSMRTMSMQSSGAQQPEPVVVSQQQPQPQSPPQPSPNTTMDTNTDTIDNTEGFKPEATGDPDEDGSVWSNTDSRQLESKRNKTVNIAAVMAQSKEREKMNSRPR
jgi:hypothetical protein